MAVDYLSTLTEHIGLHIHNATQTTAKLSNIKKQRTALTIILKQDSVKSLRIVSKLVLSRNENEKHKPKYDGSGKKTDLKDEQKRDLDEAASADSELNNVVSSEVEVKHKQKVVMKYDGSEEIARPIEKKEKVVEKEASIVTYSIGEYSIETVFKTLEVLEWQFSSILRYIISVFSNKHIKTKTVDKLDISEVKMMYEVYLRACVLKDKDDNLRVKTYKKADLLADVIEKIRSNSALDEFNLS